MKIKQVLGELEQQVVEILWDNKEISVRQVQAQLNLKHEKMLAYTTILTILTRLTDKGILMRVKKGRGHFYTTVESKDQFFLTIARNTLEEYQEQYGDEILPAFEKAIKQSSGSNH